MRAEGPNSRFDLVVGSSSTGARARNPRPGPEEELVQQFLTTFPMASRRGHRITVFREPRLESGFPDVVVVVWDPEKASPWSTERRALGAGDVRLLHLLGTAGPLADDRVAALLGRCSRGSLDRLRKLNLIRATNAGWRAEPIHRTFAVRRILAFEAKISAVTVALHQAALNRWFASESYVLLRRAPRADILARALAAGVGVWLSDATRPLLQAFRVRSGRPVSYASWLFNEWTWQHAASNTGGDA